MTDTPEQAPDQPDEAVPPPAETAPEAAGTAPEAAGDPGAGDPLAADPAAGDPATGDPATGKPEPPAEQRRPASPAAAAASRARRIGGRPTTGRPASPRPGPGPAAAAQTEPPSLREQSSAGADTEPPAAPPLSGPADPHAAAAAGPAAGPAEVPAWLNWAPAGVLAAGAVVMAVLLVVFSHGVWWGPSPAATPSAGKVNQQREQVLAAAKSCVAAANDYSYEDLDGYEKRALACTTGGLTAKLRQTIDSLIKQNAPQIKAKQTTQITRGGIESISPEGEQWTLLIFGQLSVVNSNYPKGRTDPFGAQVRMEKAHGKWVMADLQVVSSPVQG